MFLFGLNERLNRPGQLFYNDRTAAYIESFYNDFNPDDKAQNLLDRRGVRRNVLNVKAKLSITDQRVDSAGIGGDDDETLSPSPEPTADDDSTAKPTSSPSTSSDETKSPTKQPITSQETSAPTSSDQTIAPTLNSPNPSNSLSPSSIPSTSYIPSIVVTDQPSQSNIPTVAGDATTTPTVPNLRETSKSKRRHGSTRKVDITHHISQKTLKHRRLNEPDFHNGDEFNFSGNEAQFVERSLQFTIRDCSGEFLAVQFAIELSYQLRGGNSIDLDDIIAEPFRTEVYRATYMDDFLKNPWFGNVGPFSDLTCTSPILFPGDLATLLPTYSPTMTMTDSPTTYSPTSAPSIIPTIVSTNVEN